MRRAGALVAVAMALAATGCSSSGPPALSSSAPGDQTPFSLSASPGSGAAGWVLSAFNTSTTVASSPTVIGDTVLMAVSEADRKGAQAVDLGTGRVLWRVLGANVAPGVSEQPVGPSASSRAVAVGVEADTTARPVLVARDLRSGAVRWRQSLPTFVGSAAFDAPVSCGSAVCLLTWGEQQGRLQSLDSATGKARWSVTVGGNARLVWADADRIVLNDGQQITGWATGSGRRLWQAAPAGGVNTRYVATDQGGPQWLRLGDLLVGQVRRSGAQTGFGLIALDPATGAIAWTKPGWTFLGTGQPTRNSDGATLAASSLLALGPRHQVGAVEVSGRLAWSVPDDQYWRYGTAIAWSSDLSQVWVGDGQGRVEGRSTATGASLRTGPPILWKPTVDALSVASLGATAQVDPTTLKPGTLSVAQVHAIAAPPTWAGPAVAGWQLSVDSAGNLTALRR